MAQPNKYKHYLRFWDTSGTPAWKYYIVSAGVVSTTTTKTELTRAPEGWQEFDINHERGWTYYGIYTTYSLPLKFLKDGAKILRHIMYTYGVEGNTISLLIERQDPATWLFSTFFEGEVDMSKAIDEFDYIIAPVMQGGFLEKLKSREDTEYVYDLDNSAFVVWVKHDGRDLQALLKWSGTPNDNFDFYPNIYYWDKEGSNIAFRPYSQTAVPGQITIMENASGNSVSVDFEVDYNFNVTTGLGTSNANAHLIFVLYSLATGIVSEHYILNSGYTHIANTLYNYSGNNLQTITIPANHGIYVGFRMYVIGGGGLVIPGGNYSTQLVVMNIKAYFINRFEPSFIPTIRVSDLIYNLLQSINDGVSVSITDTLSTIYLNDQVVLTSGDGIRFLEGCKLTCSLKSVFEFLNTKFSASLTYDTVTEIVTIGRKEDVFEDAVNPSISLGDVSNFTATPFTELMFTNLEIGSERHDYDSTNSDGNQISNGKDEFNTLTKRLSPLTRMNGKTENYVSSIRCDMTGIELVRVNLGDKELADARTDNEVFALHINSAPTSTESILIQGVLTVVTYYELYRKPINLTPGASYFEIEHIFSPETAYNIIFSPLRSLLNNGTWFRSILKFSDAEQLTFQMKYKNRPFDAKMVISEGATPTVYDEGAAVTISSLCSNDDVIFQPVRYKFKTKEDIDINEIVNTYPFRYIPFTVDGVSLKGYIIKLTSQPTWRGTTEFELLAHRDDVLTNLIR